jgi:hypothetical protein
MISHVIAMPLQYLPKDVAMPDEE